MSQGTTKDLGGWRMVSLGSILTPAYTRPLGFADLIAAQVLDNYYDPITGDLPWYGDPVRWVTRHVEANFATLLKSLATHSSVAMQIACLRSLDRSVPGPRESRAFRKPSAADVPSEFHAAPYLRPSEELFEAPPEHDPEIAGPAYFLAQSWRDQADKLSLGEQTLTSAARDKWQRLARRRLLDDSVGRRLYRTIARIRRAALAALRPRWWRLSYPPPSRIVAQFRTALAGTLTRTAPPLAMAA